jgi:hypothetical protein
MVARFRHLGEKYQYQNKHKANSNFISPSIMAMANQMSQTLLVSNEAKDYSLIYNSSLSVLEPLMHWHLFSG